MAVISNHHYHSIDSSPTTSICFQTLVPDSSAEFPQGNIPPPQPSRM